MKVIPYNSQFTDDQDIQDVVDVLKSDWLTQGPTVQKFENALCEYTGAKYAVAVSSGTAALHLSLLALDLSKKDEVITSPITFAASANCALYVGANPRFIDISDETYQLDLGKLEDFLKVPSQRANVKVVIPVHFMGIVMDMPRLRRICNKYKIKIVEDAAHALGASYYSGSKLRKVGSCAHSDMTIFSFHPIKNMTTGEGGAILTNSKKIYEKVVRLRHHGMIKNRLKPFWYYDIPEIGFNYRITDIQCALGLSQLKKLDSMINTRAELVKNYNRELESFCSVKLPKETIKQLAAYHLYVIRVKSSQRDKLYEHLRQNNISTQVNYIPVHLLSFYGKKLGYKMGDFPVAEKYFKECLSLPLYVGLSKSDQNRVLKVMEKFFNE